jgi:hypothetical protein
MNCEKDIVSKGLARHVHQSKTLSVCFINALK